MHSTLPARDADVLALAKSKGNRKPRKDTKTGQEIDINLYVYQHDGGVAFAYENSTSDKELDEEITFELKGLRIDENPSATKLNFVVGPNSTKVIRLSKTSEGFAISYNVSYLVKQASTADPNKAILGLAMGVGGLTVKGDAGSGPADAELKKKAKSQGSCKQRKETKTGNEVEIFQYVLQHDDGVFILYENRTKDFALDEELTFDMQGLTLKENPGKTSVKIELPPQSERAIHLVKTGPAFSIKYSMSYLVKFAGKGSFGSARLPEHELRKLAKEKGQQKQRKDNKTGEVVDIVLYVLQHDQGVFLYYENNTKNYELEEEVKFELKGLQLAEDPKGNTVKFALKPGQSRGIILDSTKEEFSISYNVSYMIRQL